MPADGQPKKPLTTRWTKTKREALEVEAARAGVPLSALLEASVDRFMALSPASRDKALAAVTS
jgi:hypothetical protein